VGKRRKRSEAMAVRSGFMGSSFLVQIHPLLIVIVKSAGQNPDVIPAWFVNKPVPLVDTP
jgi:hypothetical protein